MIRKQDVVHELLNLTGKEAFCTVQTELGCLVLSLSVYKLRLNRLNIYI